jgi:hypothetical protein
LSGFEECEIGFRKSQVCLEFIVLACDLAEDLTCLGEAPGRLDFETNDASETRRLDREFASGPPREILYERGYTNLGLRNFF